jgi:hypothetical protein
LIAKPETPQPQRFLQFADRAPKNENRPGDEPGRLKYCDDHHHAITNMTTPTKGRSHVIQ